MPPGRSIPRCGGVGGSSTPGPPFPGSRPSRKRGDSEDVSEGSSRGSTPVGGKRRRRDGSDIAGHWHCVFKLTPDENTSFMDNIRELYEKEQLCDITLSVEGEEFRAHKAVLACSKSFLGTLMMSNMRESTQDVIELEDISSRQFKILLDYMYNKPISVPSSQMMDLLSLANRYQVEGLKDQMCDALSTHLTHDNACSVFALADSHQCHTLKTEAFSKIVQHFALATRSDGWTALNKDQLSEVLSSDQVLDCDESVVFDAASRWLLLDSSPSRRRFAPEVLGMVRLPLMDAGLLSDVIKDHEATKGPECQKLVAEAFEHHALKAVGREGLTGTPRTKQRRRSCSFKQHTLLKEHQDAVSALAVVNGKLVSGSWDTSIKVWDPQSWTTERTLSDHTGPVRCFAQCAGRLLSGSDDSCIKVWNTDTWSLVRSLDDHTDAVNAATDCNGRLASGSDDGTIKLWNTENWQCEVTIHQHQADHTCGVLALATCGDYLVSGSDGGIKVWNTHNWTCHKEVLGHGDEIWSLAVVGDKLISGSIDSTIRVWETQTWGCEKQVEDHAGPVYALTVLEGKLVSASSDHTIRVWGPDWVCCRTLECSGVWSLNVFNDRLVSGSLDNAVKVWGA
ncbi:unnamed protein product [Ectocarpus sp. 12 AP-2014]